MALEERICIIQYTPVGYIVFSDRHDTIYVFFIIHFLFSMDQKNVIVYSTPTCAFCHMAKEFFTEKGIAFTEHDVAADEAKRNEMVEKTGQMGVPVIVIGDEVVIGFDQARIAELLGL